MARRMTGAGKHKTAPTKRWARYLAIENTTTIYLLDRKTLRERMVGYGARLKGRRERVSELCVTGINV